ncbi:SMI1/KNR4 family protein [Alienimonas chondri]|uniref:Knr4/Smi1-like domain-containing protein n=1 Tax=Alienimonas chondri TaxID=2681879 RepID=A0ABX1VHF6_9PLAN|nr:SMI1/KNR4 family protein [Alienimonas chondri]NNJ27277.1 hypothetical protein [Alienimonas chondri]
MPVHPAAIEFNRLTRHARVIVPAASFDLNPPATESALDLLEAGLNRAAPAGLTAAEVAAAIGGGGFDRPPDPNGPSFGRPLPEDLAAVLRRHDGAGFLGLLPVRWEPGDDPDLFTPLPAAWILEQWEGQRDLLAIREFADAVPNHTDSGVRPTWWDERWLPFAGNGGGDLLFLDYSPAPGGTAGQVVSHDHETGEHRVQALSLAALLEAAADAFESGKYRWISDGGSIEYADD